MTPAPERSIPDLGAWRPLALGLAACAILVLGTLGWAARAAISGAVIASGEVDAAPYRHSVQHPEGGVIAQILVQEGQEVMAGDLLLRLDGATLTAERAILEVQAIEAEARLARLLAERDGGSFLPPLVDTRASPAQEAIAAQARLFAARRDRLAQEEAQLAQRRLQAEAELAGLVQRAEQMAIEAALLDDDLRTQRILHDRGLTQSLRASDLARESARLAADRAAVAARRVELRGRIAEITLQADALRSAHRQEVEEQLADTTLARAELQARRAILRVRQAALEVRAPVSGAVHGLRVTGTGAVLRPADDAMQILNRDLRPVLAMRVSPDDIDHVHLGQAAMLRFPALESHDLPELPGMVTSVSAAPFVDEHTGARFFRVGVTLTPESFAALGGRVLVAGMTAQAFITTGQRTPLDYLLAPIRDQMARALRDP